MDSYVKFLQEFCDDIKSFPKFRISIPKYNIRYECKCGKIVDIKSETKWTPKDKRWHIYNDKKCIRKSYKNPCKHKYIKTVTKILTPPRIEVDRNDPNKAVLTVNKKYFEKLVR